MDKRQTGRQTEKKRKKTDQQKKLKDSETKRQTD